MDGQTWQAYGRELESNLRDLSDRLAPGRTGPSRSSGCTSPRRTARQRPIGIPALEDKIVQRRPLQVLNAVYETDFLGFSYGFRPGRSAAHGAGCPGGGIESRKVNWLLDADIKAFFDTLSHEWLVEFVGQRIADPRVVRHIQKWLNAGVMEEGDAASRRRRRRRAGACRPCWPMSICITCLTCGPSNGERRRRRVT